MLSFFTEHPALGFFLVGIAAGALTGVPIGPVNVAVIDAAYRHTMRRAIAVGMGGSVADGLYAALGLLGVTPVLRSYAWVSPILYAVSGVVLLIYGFLTARNHQVAPPHPEGHAPAAPDEMWQGFQAGLMLILLNPAAVVTWVVITEQITDHLPEGTRLDGMGGVLGVVIGSFAWFALVAWLTQRGKHVLGDKAAWIPRVIGIALMVYAVYLLIRAVKFFLA